MTDIDEIKKINDTMEKYLNLMKDIDESKYDLSSLIKNAIIKRIKEVGYYIDQDNWQVELPLGIYIKEPSGVRQYYCFLEICNKEDTDYVLLANDDSNIMMSKQDDFIHLYENLYRMGFWWDDDISKKDVA